MKKQTKSSMAKAKKAQGKADTWRTLVDNPYHQQGHPESVTNPRRIHGNVNVRESAVETLYARRFLGSAQKRAGRSIPGAMGGHGGKTGSLDYTRNRMDGGKGEAIIGKLQAAQELERCRAPIGVRGYEALEAVCGQGKALADITPQKRERLTMADNLRANLNDLAVMWRMQTRQRARA